MRFPRRSHAPNADPIQFECAGCEATAHNIVPTIPVGWSNRAGLLLCNDCTASPAMRARHDATIRAIATAANAQRKAAGK